MGSLVTGPVRGNDGLYFTLKETGATGTAEEYEGHIKRIEFTGEDKDDLTFLEVMTGDTQTTGFNLTVIQSWAAESLWRVLHDGAGLVFDVVIGLYGNAVPTAAKPHIVGKVKATARPLPSSEARTGRTREESEISLTFEDGYQVVEGA